MLKISVMELHRFAVPRKASVFQLAASFPWLDQLPWLAAMCVAVAERQDPIKIIANQCRIEAFSSVLLAPHLCPGGPLRTPLSCSPAHGLLKVNMAGIDRARSREAMSTFCGARLIGG
jgi:hypothetical protein